MTTLFLAALLAADPKLPAWLELGAELRGRVEGATGQDFLALEDAYYLHRVRLNAILIVRPWLRVVAQAQDSHAPGFRTPKPASVINTFDLRQAYLEARGAGKEHWGVRAGRQEMAFGAERLIGFGNWGNVSRSFDGVRVFRETETMRADWFATTLVVVNRDGFDRFRRTTQLHGFHSAWRSWIPRGTAEVYLYWKREAGLDLATPGVRLTGQLPRDLDYSAETALQAGERNRRAWAANFGIGYMARAWPAEPRLFTHYSHASGDRDPLDGKIRTFDNLYPTNHQHYGLADRVGWRNMHEAAGGAQWKPGKRWRLNTVYHSFWLATRGDFFHRENGTPLMRNPAARSAHIGHEVDVFAVFAWNAHAQLYFGLSHLLPGGFLKDSGRGRSVTHPYAMWRYTLD
ncbi:MAG: alginate export family protein [Bryobacteraceae bacterium]